MCLFPLMAEPPSLCPRISKADSLLSPPPSEIGPLSSICASGLSVKDYFVPASLEQVDMAKSPSPVSENETQCEQTLGGALKTKGIFPFPSPSSAWLGCRPGGGSCRCPPGPQDGSQHHRLPDQPFDCACSESHIEDKYTLIRCKLVTLIFGEAAKLYFYHVFLVSVLSRFFIFWIDMGMSPHAPQIIPAF